MIIETSRFGQLEVDEERLITFDEGILGFPDQHRYALIQTGEGSGFYWLQAVDTPGLAFVVCDPRLFVADYQVPVKVDDLQMIGLIPWVTSMVVAALLWKWLLDNELGLINYILSLLGLGRQTLLTDVSTSIYGVIYVITWRTVGYSMVMVVAGLKAIPFELEEAASIDGCSGWQILRYVRLPLIKTQLMIASIVLTMSNFNNFVVPQTLTGGGPGMSSRVITISMYKEGFTYARHGLASSIALLILVVNIILVVNYVKAVKYDI